MNHEIDPISYCEAAGHQLSGVLSSQLVIHPFLLMETVKTFPAWVRVPLRTPGFSRQRTRSRCDTWGKGCCSQLAFLATILSTLPANQSSRPSDRKGACRTILRVYEDCSGGIAAGKTLKLKRCSSLDDNANNVVVHANMQAAHSC